MKKYVLQSYCKTAALLVALSSFCQAAFTQVYPFINYSSRQGLINASIYAITQDKEGFLWLGTENGLSRFDGKEFRNFSLEQLGLNSYISSVIATDEGGVLFGSANSGLYILEPHTGIASQLTRHPLLRSNKLILKDGVVISLFENQAYHFIDLKTGLPVFSDNVFEQNTSIKALSMANLADGRVLFGRTNGIYTLNGKRQEKISIDGLPDIPVYSIFEDRNAVLAGTDSCIYKIVNNSVTDIIPIRIKDHNKIRNLARDIKGNLWFNFWGEPGLYMMKDDRIIDISQTSGLNAGLITGIFCERTGAVCVVTMNSGLYVFNNSHLTLYPGSKLNINGAIHKIIKPPGNSLLLGTDHGVFSLNLPTGSVSQVCNDPAYQAYIKDIVPFRKNNYLVGAINPKLGTKLTNNSECRSSGSTFDFVHCSAIYCDSNSIYIGNWDNKISEYNSSDFKITRVFLSIFPNKSNTHRINCIYKDRHGNLWVGSQLGLCAIDHSGNKYFFKDHFSKNEILTISRINNDTIIVTTNTGLYLVAINNLPTESRIVYSRVVTGTLSGTQTGTNEFLLGSISGLYFLDHDDKKVVNYNEGILSENINDILYDPESSIAWIASTEGIIQININSLREREIPVCKISHLTVTRDTITWTPDSVSTFAFSRNSFNLNFLSFNYNYPEQILYEYKIDNGNWINTPSHQIQFASLDPGTHTVMLRAGLKEAGWGPVRKITIIITPPFYRTWTFYIFVATVVTAAVYLLIRYQLKQHRLKQEEKNIIQSKIVELQQKALASNLNPHFIFNSLNSIQNFINTHNSEKANEYLARFSRLMRMHLNMADKTFISLEEEINRLEYYLVLEQLRFGENLSWSIMVNPSIDRMHTHIPNMIIQPFIENAIWHGIMPVGTGAISVSLDYNREMELEIRVRDNGIGYYSTQNKTHGGHESKGISLIRERLTLLQPGIEDVLTFRPLEPGTEVLIRLTSRMFRKSPGVQVTFPQRNATFPQS